MYLGNESLLIFAMQNSCTFPMAEISGDSLPEYFEFMQELLRDISFLLKLEEFVARILRKQVRDCGGKKEKIYSFKKCA